MPALLVPELAGSEPGECLPRSTGSRPAPTAAVAKAEGYIPGVDLRHLEVTLRVTTSTEAGVTEMDFEVA